MRWMKVVSMIFAVAWGITASAEKIYFSADATAAERFASKDMARCLSLVTGKAYQAEQWSGQSFEDGSIIIGNIVKQMKDYKAPVLKSQEWHMHTIGNYLLISGGDPAGTVYGIYDFLENHAGCSWFAPDTEVVNSNPNWVLPKLEKRMRPAFLRREMYVGYDYMDGIWRMRNKENFRASFAEMNLPAGSPAGCHTFAYYTRDCLKDPKLFGVNARGGECKTICLTNPEVRKLITEQLKKYIESDRKKLNGKPELWPIIYDISQDDGASGSECHCMECKRVMAEEGEYSGVLIHFINAIAREIKKTHPEIILRTFAYSYTQKPPKYVIADENVIIQTCNSGLWKPALPGTENGKILEDWSKNAKNLGIWSYWKQYQEKDYPYIKNLSDAQKEIQFFRARNVRHYFAENENPLTRTFYMLQAYIANKLWVNPDLNLQQEIRKFMNGYYGAGAPPIQKYLAYLEKRQNPKVNYLDNEFYQTVNRYFDEAEKLAKDDAKSLLHIRWERSIVDSSMMQRWKTLSANGNMPSKEIVVNRFEKNSIDTIKHWKTLPKGVPEQRISDIQKVAKLFHSFPIQTPKQFDGMKTIDFFWNEIFPGSEIISDNDAAGKSALRVPIQEHKLPYSIGFYDSFSKKGDACIFNSRIDIPQDEKFHFHKVARIEIMPGAYIYANQAWTYRHYLKPVGIVPEPWEIWISLKFTGPAYVQNSIKNNAILIDRILYVKNENPLNSYHKANSTENLLKNGGFEISDGSKIASWIFPAANQSISHDSTVKHSGNSSLKVANIASGTYASIVQHIGKLEDLNSDLLIRGWVKYEKMRNDKVKAIQYSLPEFFFWTWSTDGKNSYSRPLLTIYPGNQDWIPFESIISAESIQKRIQNIPGDKKPVKWGINIYSGTQSGTIWFDDIEVIPLKKKISQK